jgi:hypothetical protein
MTGPGAAPDERPDGAALIAAERRRQIEVECWTYEHDRNHWRGELVQAAIFYADPEASAMEWPWAELPKAKGEDRVRDLVKAGALIAAEIDRLQETQ